MSQSIQVVWETTVIETHKRTVALVDLPASVREAWEEGQVLVTEHYSDTHAHNALIEWIEEIEEEPYSDAVTERKVTETNELDSLRCGQCGWETPEYTSRRIATAALENHTRAVHA